MRQRALTVLGLTGDPSPQEIRRAYLRKVKEHPPERDREGFERVREAFEFLKSSAGPVVLEAAATLPIVVPNATTVLRAPEVAATFEVAAPPSAFKAQLDELCDALAQDELEVAAQLMIDLYERPPAQAAPVAPPLLCFRTFMALMGRNRFEVGRQLLAAFEKHAALNGLESGMEPELGARWTLAREVAALSLHEQSMTQAVAQSLGSGHIYTAGYAAQDAYERGVALERIMRQHAPTVWESLTPHLKATRAEVERATGKRYPYWMLGLLVVGFLRFCNVFSDATPGWGLDSGPQQHASAPRAPEREDLTPSPASHLTFRERAQLEIDHHWLPIVDLAERGDCAGVRERLPPYLKVAGTDLVNRPTAVARRKLLLEHCKDLTDLLDEP